MQLAFIIIVNTISALISVMLLKKYVLEEDPFELAITDMFIWVFMTICVPVPMIILLFIIFAWLFSFITLKPMNALLKRIKKLMTSEKNNG